LRAHRQFKINHFMHQKACAEKTYCEPRGRKSFSMHVDGFIPDELHYLHGCLDKPFNWRSRSTLESLLQEAAAKVE
jgi:hypothetical protein